MSDAWPIDHAVLDAIVAHRTPWLDVVPLAVGVVGTSPVGLGLIALLAGAAALRWRAWRPAAAVVVAVLVSGEIVGLLKDHFARPRPDPAQQLLEGTGYAFPSTHAAFTSAAVTALVVAVAWRSARMRRRVAVVLAVAVLGVGTMMIYLGSHWFSDVVVGWLLGVPIGGGIGLLLRQRRPRPGRLRPGRGAAGSAAAGQEELPLS